MRRAALRWRALWSLRGALEVSSGWKKLNHRYDHGKWRLRFRRDGLLGPDRADSRELEAPTHRDSQPDQGTRVGRIMVSMFR